MNRIRYLWANYGLIYLFQVENTYERTLEKCSNKRLYKVIFSLTGIRKK